MPQSHKESKNHEEILFLIRSESRYLVKFSTDNSFSVERIPSGLKYIVTELLYLEENLLKQYNEAQIDPLLEFRLRAAAS